MFPILFTIGHFSLRTMVIFSVIGFFLSGFILWRKGREEHYSEAQLFDGFLLSTVAGFVIGRLGHVLLHFSEFGWNFWKWLDFVSVPGTQPLLGMAGGLWYFYLFAKNKKWDAFEALDYYVTAAVFGLFWRYIGAFFDGSQYGLPTTMPWGLIFPGMQEKVHPIQLYFATFCLVWFGYLLRVEYRYRLFEWYRSGKKTAETGFLVAITLIAFALFSLAMTWFKLPEVVVNGWVLDRWLYIALAGFGAVLLWSRSGRGFLSGTKSP
jgi:phosphatidylglycerol:prolipoprotein diacylglycerol transferase